MSTAWSREQQQRLPVCRRGTLGGSNAGQRCAPQPPAQPSVPSSRYGGGSFSFSRLISAVTQRFNTEFELKQVSGCRLAPIPSPACPAEPRACRALVAVTGCSLRGPRAAPALPSPPSQLEQFKADNQDIGFGSGTRALEQALERTRTNINWVKENKEVVHAWFRAETASS